MTIETCLTCRTSYSTTQKQAVIQLMLKEDIPVRIYPSTCLTCIIQELHQEKSHYRPNLLSATSELKAARKAYFAATSKHQSISSKYTKYDQQAGYLQFFLMQETSRNTAKKASSAKQSSKAKKLSDAKQEDIIATLLASLTPEQQALVVLKSKTL